MAHPVPTASACDPARRGFAAGLSLVRDWPSRTAVVVGDAAQQDVVATMDRVGFTSAVTSVDDAERTAAQAGPFVFLLVGADAFTDDDGVEQVRNWHRRAPSSRLKLVVPGGTSCPEVLVRAIRAGVTDILDSDRVAELEAAIRSGLAQAGKTRERVLAVGAHPDDIEIGCGGTLLDHRRRGDRISILTLSRGEVGGDQASRLEEAASTADAIGAQLLLAELEDTRIDSGVDTIRLIENVVEMVDPTVVYVHSIHDSHQDHRAVSTATRSATRGVRRVFAYQSPSATNDFLPTQFVDVDAVLSRKVAMLRLFHSQGGRSYLEPELVVAGARYWARHLATTARYAEPFEVIRSIGELRHSVLAPAYAEDRDLAVLTPQPPVLPSEASPR